LGIEALSRGAVEVAFVERDPRVLERLRDNLERLNLAGETTVIAGDALHPENWRERGFPARIVFADPPYRRGLALGFLDALSRGGLPTGKSLIIVEHERELDLGHPGFGMADHRVYGDTALTFLTSPEKENAA
jgi:16S rRNA (guanine966-N2)-methyltransferase